MIEQNRFTDFLEYLHKRHINFDALTIMYLELQDENKRLNEEVGFLKEDIPK